jgi:hypothetical protein
VARTEHPQATVGGLTLRSVALRIAVVLILGSCGALSLVFASRWPLPTLSLLVVAPLSVWALSVLSNEPIERTGIWLVVAIQATTLGAGTWLMDPLNTLLDVLRAGGALGTIVVVGLHVGPKLPESPVRATALLALAYAIWTVLGGQFAFVPARSAFVGVSLAGLVVVVVVVFAAWKDPAQPWTRFLAGTQLLAAVLCLGCMLLAVAGVEAAQAPRFVGAESKSAFRGLFLNSGLMGEIGALAIACVLARRAGDANGRFDGVAYASMGVGLATVFASASRASLVGISAGALTFLLVQGRGRTRARGMLLGALTLLAVGGLLWELGAMDTTLGRITGGSMGISLESETRWVLWRMSLQTFLENPITGLGFGGIPASAGYLEARVAGSVASHSAVVEYMLAPGLPGLLLFGLLLVRATRGMLTFPDRTLVRSLSVYGGVMLPIYLTGTSCSPVGMLPYALWVPLLLAASLPDWRKGSARPTG